MGPDYRPPEPVTPDEWHALPQTGLRVESPDAPSLAAWWTTLNDPLLNELIERALAANKTVQQARARSSRRAPDGASPLPASFRRSTPRRA